MLASETATQSALPVDLLRNELKARGLQGFFIPLTDAYQNEYIPDSEKRLDHITGFSGSTGFCIVTKDRAALFVDGRYTIEARDSVDTAVFEIEDYTRAAMATWLRTALSKKDKLGFDPWVHTQADVTWMRETCEQNNFDLEPQEDNPIDAIWVDRPERPQKKIRIQPVEFSGKGHEEKIQDVVAVLHEKKLDAVAITATDCVAWLLNLRGQDIPFNPVFLAYAVVHKDNQVHLIVDTQKINPDTLAHLGENVHLIDEANTVAHLKKVGAKKGRIQLDAAQSPYAMSHILQEAGATISFGDDPCALPKALKNDVELEGARTAHIRDGVALCKFMYWLAQNAHGGEVTEISAADKLQEFREENALLQDLSFPTISGAGPNGAVIHYRVSKRTNRPIDVNQIYLVDSGGQYTDGTTDVTRTVIIGAPTAEQKDRFTRVLKGHIALGAVKFPAGTTGSQLDVLARHSLWQAGLDYAHGTGHGVGSYMNVHEGPQRISKSPSTVPLEPGMIVSNEPGYYKEGEYGIRIENLVAVVSCDDIEDAESAMLQFDDLTLVPIDRDLIMVDLLTESEIIWLNDYHAKVRQTLMPLLDEEVGQWLTEVTAPV